MPEATSSKRVPRAIREQQMLDAAVQVFSRRGYHAASMDEVAEASGISKPMLYLYHGSKEELFISCIRREADRMLERMTAAVEAASTFEERFAFGIEAFFGYVSERSDSWRVLYFQGRTLGPPFTDELDRARHAIIDVITGLVGGRDPDEGPGPAAESIAYALVGAGDALAEWAPRAGEDAAGTTARLMNIVWLGLERYLAGEHWHKADSA
ncbi:MAG TPA: TetR/AcrR family transcriptional regulator [Jiangellaceae bacterium]